MNEQSEYAKQLHTHVMTDEQVIAQIDKCIGDGVPINISTMRRGLEILLYERHERQKVSALKTGIKPIKGTCARVYDFLVSFIAECGYPPSNREIGEGVGLLSPSTVHRHLDTLEKLGYILKDPTKPRAITIIGAREAAL